MKKSTRHASWLIYFILFLFLTGFTSAAFDGDPQEKIAWKSPTLDDGRRYLALMFSNDNEDDQYLDVIENGKNKGFNALYVTVRMDAVKCHNQGCVIGSSMNPNWNPANRSWTQTDAQIAKAKQLGMKIAIRIHLGNSDFGGNIRSSYLWGPGRLAADPNGNTDLGGYNFTKFTLSSQPAIDSAKKFIQEVLNRYGYLEGENNLLFISFSNTSSQELEYDHGNLIDYSNASKNEYTSWYLTNYGTTNPNVPTEFTSTEGKKWYRFRHCKLKNFVSQLTGVVKSHNSNIKTIHDVGSAFDVMSSKRGTLGFKSLAEHSDGFKVNDGFDYDHRFSMDILRGSLPGKMVMNETFLVDYLPSGYYSSFANDVFAHGGKFLSLVTVNNTYLNQYAGDWSSIASTWLNGTNGNMSPVNANGTINYTFNEILNGSFNQNKFSSGSRNIYQEWLNQYNANPSGGKPVNVVLNDSELSCSSCTPPSPPSLSASPSTITIGNSSTLSASGCSGGTITWSDGLGTGASMPVSPTATKTYTATCSVAGCTSAAASVTVTVQGSTPCGYINKQTVGTWNGLNVQTRQYTVNGSPAWLIVTAVSNSSTDKHFPRGSNFADRNDITWTNGVINKTCLGGGGTGWDGLVMPSNVTIPSGYTQGTEPDGAIYFQQSCTPPSAPTLSASPSTITTTNGSSTLTASGCSSGTITWSDGLGTGSPKTVSPSSTKTYTATCSIGGCTSGSASVTVTVNVPPTSGVNCNTLTSDMNGVNCGFIEGWIYDASHPNTPVNVDIYDGATLILSNVSANKFRQDLLNAGMGNGQHGLEVATPASLKNGQSHSITLKASGCNYTFNNSPKILSGCSNAVVDMTGADSRKNQKLNMTIAPNPSKGIFETIFFLEKGKKATILVTDLQGRTIYRQQVSGQGMHKEKINLLNKASGTLLLQLQKDNGTEVKKINIAR